VLFRFAVAAAMGGAFDPGVAIGQFAWLAVGGIIVGFVVGRLWVAISHRLHDELTLILSLTLVSWLTYLAGEAIHVSGVIATVTVGLVLGWHQHVVLSAAARLRGSSFWSVLVFVLEALVFMLIGLSLREIIEHAGGFGIVFEQLAWPLSAIVLGLTAARFAWVFGSNFLLRIASRAKLTRKEPLDRGDAIVMSWAGMRGVVTLAVALSLPEQMPARDFMLLAAFGVIFVTVVVQGSTLGLVIRLSGVRQTEADAAPMNLTAAENAVMRVQLAAVEKLARDSAGTVIHPRLLDQYSRRVSVGENYEGTSEERENAIAAHFDVVIAAVTAGRHELLRLHRAHQIDDETLQSLERDLDLEELVAVSAKS
jgi:CPA1 family monovalent cation:H+ antiporter